MSGKKTALPILFLTALALFYAVPQKEVASGEIRERAPAFSLKLFDGGELKSKDLHGKLVVLKFMASW